MRSNALNSSDAGTRSQAGSSRIDQSRFDYRLQSGGGDEVFRAAPEIPRLHRRRCATRVGADFTFNINLSNGTAFNIWQAKPGLADHRFELYQPGFHHVAFNVQTHEQVDTAFELMRSLGAEILDGPGEFPFGPGGYYAFYCLGPDRLKFEIVHMLLAEQNYRQMINAIGRGSR